MNYTIKQLQELDESEDSVEFKEATNSYPYKSKRKSILGYVTALANEGGGLLVLGMADKKPHRVVGTSFREKQTGRLKQDIYKDTKIRVKTQELRDDQDKRVLVINIPRRPVGKPLLFEDIPLMRVGDSLTRMSDEMYLSIIQEQEPDFSATICKDLVFDDLDPIAVKILKEKYSRKRGNKDFIELADQQALSDLNLINADGITYAGLILVGKEVSVKKYLPQAEINFEYRSTETQIHFDKRERVIKPIFIGLDEIWKLIDARNSSKQYQEGAYIYNSPLYFNEEVIREALLNAVAHRDYTITSETLIKQYPDKIEINNPGGLPKGVTLENIVQVNSTPRNRLLAEILEKTGLVERSGQGVDKMYRISITEGKESPDYSRSSNYQVSVILNGEIKDHAFAQFLKELDTNLEVGGKLSVLDIISLTYVRDQEHLERLSEADIDNLVQKKAVRRDQNKIILTKEYSAIKENIEGDNEKKILEYLEGNTDVKMGVFIGLFENRLTRRQVNNMIYNLVGRGLIVREGDGSASVYNKKK